jgi:uncharacterized protein YecE (DUF72 family)
MIRIGTAGWQYKDWNGIVYPEPRPRGFDALSYIAVYFDVIEINSSFYRAPRPHSAQKWLASVAHNPNFRFTAKLFNSFTHERKPAPTDEREFKAGIAPLLEANRLGALLLQFPWSFKNSPRIEPTLSASTNALQSTRSLSKYVTAVGLMTFWTCSPTWGSASAISISLCSIVR